MRLNKHIPFFARFRLRVIFQNMSNYVLLLFGIFFANTLLLFGLMFPEVLDNYQEAAGDDMLAPYQYILQLPAGAVDEENKVDSILEMLYFEKEVETENESAEKFSAYSLNTVTPEMARKEEILLYGTQPGSVYVKLPESAYGDVFTYASGPVPQPVLVSQSFSDKFLVRPGDVFHMQELYEDTEYTFLCGGIYPYGGSVCIFMGQDALNEMFDLGEDTFSGYFADSEITDINPKYIGQIIDYEALTKVSRQLTISMGSMMNIVVVFSVIMFMILIYLMSRIIIEKNAQSISMVKILGYTNREVSSLYITATSIFVVAVMILTIPLVSVLIQEIFLIAIRIEMSGWIPFIIGNDVYIKMLALGIGSYAVIAFLEYRKVRKVPMEAALKNVE